MASLYCPIELRPGEGFAEQRTSIYGRHLNVASHTGSIYYYTLYVHSDKNIYIRRNNIHECGPFAKRMNIIDHEIFAIYGNCSCLPSTFITLIAILVEMMLFGCCQATMAHW